jgi:hypothetical protein
MLRELRVLWSNTATLPILVVALNDEATPIEDRQQRPAFAVEKWAGGGE